MLQLPGFGQGFGAAPTAEGVTEDTRPAQVLTEADVQQLRQLLDELRAAGDPLASELKAMLIPLLQDGMLLPPGGQQGGTSLPPFAALAQALFDGQVSNGGQVSNDGEAQPTPLRGFTAPRLNEAAELAGKSLEKLLGARVDSGMNGGEARGTGVFSGVLDTLLEQAGTRHLAVVSSPPGLAGSPLMVTAPNSSGAMSIPSNSLLSMPVPQSIADSAWGSAIGERLVWMAKGDHQVAQLKITPPNLGVIEVRLNINHDQASVSFVSHHALVRDAIESAMPRLREMLAEQALDLVQTDVSSGQQDVSQHSPGSGAGMPASAGMFEQAMEGTDGMTTATEGAHRGLGLLDLFA